MDAEAHLGATSTSAEIGNGIKNIEGAIEIAEAAGVDVSAAVSAARARVEELRAEQARPGESLSLCVALT